MLSNSMRLLFFFAFFFPVTFLCSAYDNFSGLGRLTRPCFPAYDRNECKNTIPKQSGSRKPTSRNPPETMMFLFTPSSHDKAEQLHPCGGGLPSNTTFDTRCPTEIFVHGGGDGLCRTAWMREMKEQMFLRSNCYNVILVDWTWGNFLDVTSAYNAIVVGEQLAYVLKKIASKTGYDCEKFHVIGHSFGAIAGSHLGKQMQKKCRLGRLTALDDAVLPFLTVPEEEYLNPTDALFVDTIHTNAGDCFPFNIGNYRPLGHVNFYVNDGTHQYSCYPFSLAALFRLDFFTAFGNFMFPPLCFHNQAYQYYKASILANTDNTFLIGVQCDSYDDWMKKTCKRDCKKKGKCLPMGLDTSSYVDYSNLSNDLNRVLIYHVPTTLMCPYADHSGFTGLPLIPNNQKDSAATGNIINPSLCFHKQSHHYYKSPVLPNTDGTILIRHQCDSYGNRMKNTCERDYRKKEKCPPMRLDTQSHSTDYSTFMSLVQFYSAPTTLTCSYTDRPGFTEPPLKPIDQKYLTCK